MTRTVEGVKDLIKSCLDNVTYAGDYIISNYEVDSFIAEFDTKEWQLIV